MISQSFIMLDQLKQFFSRLDRLLRFSAVFFVFRESWLKFIFFTAYAFKSHSFLVVAHACVAHIATSLSRFVSNSIFSPDLFLQSDPFYRCFHQITYWFNHLDPILLAGSAMLGVDAKGALRNMQPHFRSATLRANGFIEGLGIRLWGQAVQVLPFI